MCQDVKANDGEWKLCYNMNHNENYVIKSKHYDVYHNRNSIMTSIYGKS